MLDVLCPADGSLISRIATDTPEQLAEKIGRAVTAQTHWANTTREERCALLTAYAAALRANREKLAALITQDAGKTAKEALAEVDGSADILLKTIADITLPDLADMRRRKERNPLGVVGLITSFNFPSAVAHWTLAPALLAGNAVVWKPSEKTPLVALECKALFDTVAGAHADLFQLTIGDRQIGEALVADEFIALVSATGSVGMGEGIKKLLAARKVLPAPSILELGGNNGVIISEHCSAEHLRFATDALLTSFLGTAGQRCTNTRRLIVHKSVHGAVVEMLREKLEIFVASGAIANPLLGASNDYGYGPLIDADAFARLEKAKAATLAEGGSIIGGERLLGAQYPQAYYVAPALALLPTQTAVMHTETFAPILFITTYNGAVDEAATLLNAPSNAGLVSGIYTQSQKEADRFAALSQAGQIVINSPKGTGTPAFGMGFGGNKLSGEGEILNAADPLAAFSSTRHFRRIAQYTKTVMNEG
jgi:aldehyde dehydrogenase (NAD+)